MAILFHAGVIPARSSPGRKVNILLLGVDERKGDRGRSDTILLLSMDWLTHRTRLLSIPRDTRVMLGKHYDKINASYASGGPEGTAKAVEDLLGVPVHYYVLTNFRGLAEIVDALGGVPVVVEKAMNYDDPYQDLHIHLKPGAHVLDGRQALGYVRFRNEPEGDIARTRRQQQFILSMVAQAIRPGNWGRLPAVWSAFRAACKTDIPVWRMPALAWSLGAGAVAGIEGKTLPGRAASISGISYWLVDKAELSNTRTTFLGIR